jgi:single-strand DNA-binding protein
MKNVTIAGRLTRDAEQRTTQSNDSVLNFSVAVDDRSQKEKATIFFDCSLWGKRGDSLRQYLGKGTSVAVSGDLATREHNGKTYLTVRVDTVTLLGGKPENRSDDDGGGRRTQPSGPKENFDLDDEIPF